MAADDPKAHRVGQQENGQCHGDSASAAERKHAWPTKLATTLERKIRKPVPLLRRCQCHPKPQTRDAT
eukprot:12916038-Prorocentrum_lima.AAC.1